MVRRQESGAMLIRRKLQHPFKGVLVCLYAFALTVSLVVLRAKGDAVAVACTAVPILLMVSCMVAYLRGKRIVFGSLVLAGYPFLWCALIILTARHILNLVLPPIVFTLSGLIAVWFVVRTWPGRIATTLRNPALNAAPGTGQLDPIAERYSDGADNE